MSAYAKNRGVGAYAGVGAYPGYMITVGHWLHPVQPGLMTLQVTS